MIIKKDNTTHSSSAVGRIIKRELSDECTTDPHHPHHPPQSSARKLPLPNSNNNNSLLMIVPMKIEFSSVPKMPLPFPTIAASIKNELTAVDEAQLSQAEQSRSTIIGQQKQQTLASSIMHSDAAAPSNIQLRLAKEAIAAHLCAAKPKNKRKTSGMSSKDGKRKK